MLTLIIVILIILGVLAIIADAKWGDGGLTFVGLVLFAIALLLGVFWCCHFHEVATAKVIDQKIEMYEEENAKIESSVSEAISKYLDYESSTLKDFKVDDISIAVAMVPELNSDSLIQQQLEILNENNKKIKELKEQKLDVNKTRWLLNFKTE